MLQARFAEHSPKVWACGDVATVHVFGGHYYFESLRKDVDTPSYETSDVQLDMCRSTVDAGFDLVYCTHAHRLQPAERYGDGLIFYGLGNWVFGGNTNPGNGTDAAGYDTGIARIRVCRRGDEVSLDGYEFIPCCISSSAGTQLDEFVPTAYTLNNYQPSPYLEGGGAWEPDTEYTDYQWWLARTQDGGWQLLSWGY